MIKNNKPYRRRQSRWWWLENSSSFFYILRELSSFFVYLWCLVLLGVGFLLTLGGASLSLIVQFFSSPVMMIFSSLSLVFLLIHSVTWFSLAPRAMPIYWRQRRLPDWSITLSYRVLFLLISASMVWVVIT